MNLKTVAVLLLALGLAACNNEPELLVLEGGAFGTRYQLLVVNQGVDAHALPGAIADTLDQLDRTFSTWRADSEISRINAAEAHRDLPLSGDFRRVLVEALAVQKLSGGALDVALLPLARAWGFQEYTMGSPPNDDTLSDLLAYTGMDRLSFGANATSLRKSDTRQGLDLSALAKGYAVDRLGELLRDAGATDFLVEFGGEILAAGERPGGGPWRVAVESPEPGVPPIELALSDATVATSGDYRNHIEVDGKRLGHVLDPRTGRPAETGAVAATVIAGNALRADALATAFLVMDEKAAFRLAEELEVGLRRVSRQEYGLHSRQNEAFKRRIMDQP